MKKFFLLIVFVVIQVSVAAIVPNLPSDYAYVCKHRINLKVLGDVLYAATEELLKMADNMEIVIRSVAALHMSTFAVARAIVTVQNAKEIATRMPSKSASRLQGYDRCMDFLWTTKESLKNVHDRLLCTINELFLDVNTLSIINDGPSGKEGDCVTRYVSNEWSELDSKKWDSKNFATNITKASGVSEFISFLCVSIPFRNFCNL